MVAKPRIAIAGFQHETNVFAARRTGFRDFEMAGEWPGLLRGDDVLHGLKDTTLPLWGFADAVMRDGGAALVPVLWCAADPASFVRDDAFERITEMIFDGIKKAGGIDAIYLDLHGAMVTESHDDGEGELLRRLRDLSGRDIPVAFSLDNHANISDAMVEHSDAITVFRSYPHLDMDETGARCWPVMRQLLEGHRYKAALRKSPYLIPLHAQFTGVAPLAGLYDEIAAVGASGGAAPMQWAELATGFPASDTRHTAPAILAWAGSEAEAGAIADGLMESFIKAEGEYDCAMMTPGEAVAAAMAVAESASAPVILADVEDNPGGGGSSDNTALLAALVAGGAKDAVLGMLHDPGIARQAHEMGVGGVFDGALGGRSAGGAPFACRMRVEALSDGSFTFMGDMYRGIRAEIGACALLLIEDNASSVRVIVSSMPCQCLDRVCFSHIGVDPAACRILAVKSTVHFRADFDSIAAAKVISVKSGGRNPCCHEEAGFRNLPHGIRLWPMGREFRP